jgi:NADH dehydrogenase
VNKFLPIPGIADYAHGFRSIAEAIYLRDHIIRQLELTAVATDPEERRARSTFVVVGAGYTGTEVTAHGQLLTTRLARNTPGLAVEQIRWMLLDTAPRLLPELNQQLSKTADRVLRRRGVEVLTDTSVTEALAGLAANGLTRSYHLYSMSGNRMRVLADWALNATTPAEPTSLAVISAESVPLDVEKPRA